MAYDKVVDSSALNANLTAVANAIREKAGTTGSFAFPAGFVEAISNISAGGGLPNGISAMTSGEHTLASDSANSFIVKHGLGVVPTFVAVIRADAMPSKTASFYLGAYLNKTVAGKTKTQCEVYSSVSDSLSAVTGTASVTADKFYANTSSGRLAKAGTYFWIAAVIDSVV
jgi:hypothetical protein